MKQYELTAICQKYSLSEDNILEWIECQLISPLDPKQLLFDEEDLSRLELIKEMKELYQTNNDSMQIILKLIDHIHYLQNQLEQMRSQLRS